MKKENEWLAVFVIGALLGVAMHFYIMFCVKIGKPRPIRCVCEMECCKIIRESRGE